MRKNKKPIKRALDIGSNDGDFCRLLIDLNIDAYGLDIDETAVNWANKYGLKSYYGNFPNEIPDAIPKKYDAIFMNEMIYYIKDLKKALNLVNEYLNDEGLLFIKTNHANSHLFKNFSFFERFNDSVKFIPSYNSIPNWLNRTGFSLCNIEINHPDDYWKIFTNSDKLSSGFFQTKFNDFFSKIPHFRNLIRNKSARIIVIAKK